MAPGFLLHIDGTIYLLGIQGSGFLDIRANGSSFELQVGLDFTVGPLSFGAYGAIGLYSNGIALKLAVHAQTSGSDDLRDRRQRHHPDQHHRQHQARDRARASCSTSPARSRC